MAIQELSDAELIAGARKGDSDAFGELYRRHVDSARAAARALTRSHSDADDLTSEAFARVLRALQGGGGPEVSFRPYLVTAVRNVFYDKVRRNREEPSADMSDEVNVALLEAANNQEDGAFASAAFATLPERWQLVLWHTEVEGRSVAEVAPLLGLAPNAVAALAYRAREGLRQAYLQAHLRDQSAEECRECSASLGAYVRDGLSARDRRRVDAHLDGCDSCAALVVELTETNNTLRAALIPALIGVSSTAYLSGLSGGGLLGWATRVPKKPLAMAGTTVAACVVAVAAFAGVFSGGSNPAGLSGSASSVVTVPIVVPTSAAPNTLPPTVSTTATTVPPTTVPPTTEPISTAPPTTTQRPPSPPTTVRRPPTTTPVTTPPITTSPVTTPPVTVPVSTVPDTTVPDTTTTLPAASALTITTEQLSPAFVNDQFQLQVTVANTGGSAVNGIQLDMSVPNGASFVSATGTGWTCDSNASCTLNALPPGQVAVLNFTLAVLASAPDSLTFTPSISAPTNVAGTGTPFVVVVGGA